MTFVNLKEPSIEQHCTVKRYWTKHERLNKKNPTESNSNERQKGKTSWLTRIQQSGELATEEKKDVQRPVITDWVYTGLIGGLDIAIQNTHTWQAFEAKLQCWVSKLSSCTQSMCE